MPSVVPRTRTLIGHSAPITVWTPVWRRATVPVVACAEEDLSTSLSEDRVFWVSETTFSLMTVLTDLFGDGYASLISHPIEIETVIFLLEQAEAPFSVYKVRLWLALTMTIMLKYQAVCSVDFLKSKPKGFQLCRSILCKLQDRVELGPTTSCLAWCKCLT